MLLDSSGRSDEWEFSCPVASMKGDGFIHSLLSSHVPPLPSMCHHCLGLPGGNQVAFLVMENVYNLDQHYKYYTTLELQRITHHSHNAAFSMKTTTLLLEWTWPTNNWSIFSSSMFVPYMKIHSSLCLSQIWLKLHSHWFWVKINFFTELFQVCFASSAYTVILLCLKHWSLS